MNFIVILIQTKNNRGIKTLNNKQYFLCSYLHSLNDYNQVTTRAIKKLNQFTPNKLQGMFHSQLLRF